MIGKALGNCIRQGSNLKPSVPKFVKASFRVSDAGKNPGFSGVFAFTTLRPCLPKAEKTRISGGISGGTLKASSHPEQPRHARRRNPVLVPPQPAEQEPTSVPGFPCSLLLAPCSSFLAPRSLLPRSHPIIIPHGCGGEQRKPRGIGEVPEWMTGGVAQWWCGAWRVFSIMWLFWVQD